MLVLTDGIDWDRFWIEQLFDVTTAIRRFELAYFWRSLATASDRQTVLRLRRAAETATRRHRAQADAELLRDMWIVATTNPH